MKTTKSYKQGAYQLGFDAAYGSVSWQGHEFYKNATIAEIEKVIRIKSEMYDFNATEFNHFKRGFMKYIMQNVMGIWE